MNKFSRAFDFQRFQQDDRLASVIDETENHYVSGLAEEDLEMVSAAGEDELISNETMLILPMQLPKE